MHLDFLYTKPLSHKKILITGALGFIGRSLTERILELNSEIEIYGIDIKDFPQDKSSAKLQKMHYEKVDIRDENAVRKFFTKESFDGVIHLAAVSRVVDAENNKTNCINTNYRGTRFIVEEVAKTPQTWLIFGSSREVYGEQKKFPISEEMEKLPLNIYGCYKLMGEELVRNHIQKNIILRFSNVYGNTYDLPGRVIPNFVRKAMNRETLILEGGNQIIDFTFIDDTVNSIIKSMVKLTTKEIQQETIHILPGVGNKITDIISILKKNGFTFNVKINPKRNYDVEQFIGDPSKRRRLLGNDDFINLENGIQRLIENIQSSPIEHNNSLVKSLAQRCSVSK